MRLMTKVKNKKFFLFVIIFFHGQQILEQRYLIKPSQKSINTEERKKLGFARRCLHTHHIHIFFILLTHKGSSHREVYKEFQSSYDIFRRWCQVPCIPSLHYPIANSALT